MFEFPPMFGGGENPWDEPDVVLTYLVTALVNGMGLDIGVTLMARGLVISGTLTSERSYLDRISEMLKEQVQFTGTDVPEEAQKSLKELLDLRALSEFDLQEYFARGDAALEEDDDIYDDDGDDYDDMLDDLPPPLQYLHLKDPIIVAGEPPINFGEGSDVIIRLRMTAIDGWMLGKITPDISNYIDFDDNGTKH